MNSLSWSHCVTNETAVLRLRRCLALGAGAGAGQFYALVSREPWEDDDGPQRNLGLQPVLDNDECETNSTNSDDKLQRASVHLRRGIRAPGGWDKGEKLWNRDHDGVIGSNELKS